MAKSRVDILVNMRGGKEAERQMRGLGDSTKRTLNMARGLIAGGTLLAVARGFKEIVDRGARMQGVENAFRRTGLSLNELEKATRGTVSQFELMQQAVSAKNLIGNVEGLPDLLKFATIRAREMGVEADYLAESIVKGIGRKSVLILDNLGLSASEVAEEFKKTGDFAQAVGNIVKRDMKDMQEDIAPAADSVDKVTSSFANLFTVISKGFVDIGTESGYFQAVADRADMVSSGLQDMFKGITLMLSEAPKEPLGTIDEVMASIAEKTEKTLTAAEKLEEEYQTWKLDQEIIRVEAEKIAKFQERYENSLFRTSQLRQQIIDQGIADIPNMLFGGKSEEEIDAIWDSIIQGYIDMANAQKDAGDDAFDIKLVTQYAETVQSIAKRFESAWSQAILNTWNQTDSFFENMAAAFEAMIASMVATLASRAAVFGLLSIFTDATGLLNVSNFGEFMFKGFQHGGSFEVGGRGGTDSQMVAFRATPGERVTVQTPEQQESGGINIHFHGSITDREMIQREIIPQIKKAVRLQQA